MKLWRFFNSQKKAEQPKIESERNLEYEEKTTWPRCGGYCAVCDEIERLGKMPSTRAYLNNDKVQQEYSKLHGEIWNKWYEYRTIAPNTVARFDKKNYKQK